MLKTKNDAINSWLDKLNEEKLKKYSKEYDFIFKIANNECYPPSEVVETKRGRKAKGKERSLIE